MVEQQRQRVEQEMTKMIDDVDKRYLRKLQERMHRCAAECCKNQEVSAERVQQCVETCTVPLNKAQVYVQKEMEGLQNRLQRCVMECNDDVKDKMGPNPSDADVNKFTVMFENCATKCVDKHIGLIPTVMKAMRTVLERSTTDS